MVCVIDCLSRFLLLISCENGFEFSENDESKALADFYVSVKLVIHKMCLWL